MRAETSSQNQSQKAFYVIVSLAIAFKLWLTSEIRIVALFAPHDASNFIEHARAITAGSWFGPYNDLTLIKQPFFPIYLAALEQFGIPLTLAHIAIYALACLVACIALRPILRNAYALGGLFVVLYFNPIEVDFGAWLAYRSQINPTLALFVFSFAAGIYARRHRPIRMLAPWFAGLSISFSAFMLTREEAIWIVPCVALFLGLFLWTAWKSGVASFVRRSCLVATVPAIWLLSSAIIMLVNFSVYGWAVTSENVSPAFVGAYDSLARLNKPSADPQYPVPLRAREQAYRVSAAARELKPSLEGPLGKGWGRVGCVTLGACADIHAGWFIWAFRDSVASAGHYSNGANAEAFYKKLAREIDDACADGSVVCEPKAHTLSPPFTISDIGPLFANFAGGMMNLVRYQELDFEPWHAPPSPAVVQDYNFLVGSTSSGEGFVSYSGWLVHAPLRSIGVTGDNPDSFLSSIDFKDSPDLASSFAHGPNAALESGASRFLISTSCISNCAILLIESSGRTVRVPLSQSQPNFTGPGVVYHLENVTPSQIRSYDFDLKKAGIAEIGRTYQRLVPTLFAISLIMLVARFAFVVIRKRRDLLEELAPSLIALITSASLIFLLAYISTVSFGAFYAEYMGASYPPLIFAIYVTLAVEARRIFLAIPSLENTALRISNTSRQGGR